MDKLGASHKSCLLCWVKSPVSCWWFTTTLIISHSPSNFAFEHVTISIIEAELQVQSKPLATTRWLLHACQSPDMMLPPLPGLSSLTWLVNLDRPFELAINFGPRIVWLESERRLVATQCEAVAFGTSRQVNSRSQSDYIIISQQVIRVLSPYLCPAFGSHIDDVKRREITMRI